MQHVLRISRKIDYGLRAMIYLASIPAEAVVPFREIARQMDVPEDFLAKILKTLVDHALVREAPPEAAAESESRGAGGERDRGDQGPESLPKAATRLRRAGADGAQDVVGEEGRRLEALGPVEGSRGAAERGGTGGELGARGLDLAQPGRVGSRQDTVDLPLDELLELGSAHRLPRASRIPASLCRAV